MSTHNSGQIQVFTFKDGLLARLAHDLRLSLRDFEIRREGAVVRGRFRPAGLVVDGVVARDGRVDPDALDAGDQAKIRRNIADDVLHTAGYPEIAFEGELAGDAIDGRLTMVGRTCPAHGSVRFGAGRLRAEFTLVPSQWGIAPFKALAGAIRLQDRVVVVVDLPADPTGAGETTPDPAVWTGP